MLGALAVQFSKSAIAAYELEPSVRRTTSPNPSPVENDYRDCLAKGS
jgi:hypothetical protein